MFPSSFFLLAPGGRGQAVGLAVRCPACGSVSVNLVSREHVDLPFHNDGAIGVVEHVFAEDALRTIERVPGRALLGELRRPQVAPLATNASAGAGTTTLEVV